MLTSQLSRGSSVGIALAASLALVTPAAVGAQQIVRCATPFAPDGTGEDGPADCSFNQTNPLAQYAPTYEMKIPVVFHVISNTSGRGNISDARVRAQIDILNEDYGALPGTPGAAGFDTGVRFELATVDPQGNPTNGITRSVNNNWFSDSGAYWNTLAWDTSRYLNIYSNNGGGAFVLGYVPGLPQDPFNSPVGTKADRVVVSWDTVGRNAPAFPYNQGRTTSHEVGHYLGLFHTFHNGCDRGSCYSSGDRICDTNPERSSATGCPTSRVTCSTPDPVRNYMDYSDDRCMNNFTSEQARRIRCTLEFYRPNVYSRSGTAASVALRNAGSNPLSYTMGKPLIGTTINGTVLPLVTGHSSATVFAYAGSANLPFSGYVLLVDITTPGLTLPPAPGPIAAFSLPLPNISGLAGLQLFTQGVHFGGAAGFALTNSQDLTLGSF